MLFLGKIDVSIIGCSDNILNTRVITDLKLIEAKDMDSAIEAVMKFYDDKSATGVSTYSITSYSITSYDIHEVIK